MLTTKNPIHLVQITDSHLYGTDRGTLLRMNTQNSLHHVLDLVKKNEEDIDLVIATGDIAQDATVEAYNHFSKSIESLSAPMRWIPGNHDSAIVMKEVSQGTAASDKLLQVNNWLLIMLDSSVDGQVHGRLASEELEFLESSLQELQTNPQIEHCMICLHHNPVKGNAGWMKDIGLHNSIRFFEIVKQADKVRCIVYGHVHQELDFEHKGVRCLCTPSTCIQFKPNVTNFELDRINPGYRSFTLHEDGAIESRVYRIEGAALEADYSSGGY